MTAPHRRLEKHYGRDEDRQRHVIDLFERSARHYDRINQIMSIGFALTYRAMALRRAGLRPGMRMLDVATGTGLMARAAARIVTDTGRVIGLDPTGAMLHMARRAVPVPLVQGLGETLPFRGGAFDFVAMGYALRHVPDLETAFREYHRVLRPGGRLLVLEITAPASRLGRALSGLYLARVVPALTRAATGSADAESLTRYYWDTIVECVSPGVILQALCSVGFRDARRHAYGGLLSEYTATR
jgi:demethylmenaquinone methyltransferase / 2-methoxy-6-polyprenyl-1,4-benzoquinol methylase